MLVAMLIAVAEVCGLTVSFCALADKAPYQLDDQGCVRPHEGVGIGLKIDPKFIEEHPLIEGPCYV